MKIGNWSLGACNLRKIMDYKLWIMNYGFWIMDFGLWIVGLRCSVGALICNAKALPYKINPHCSFRACSEMASRRYVGLQLLLLFFCFQGLLYSDIGLTLGFSYTTWDIGKLGPSLTLESSTITIYNLGNAYCQVLVKSTNSENWTLSTSPGYDQFQLQIKGGDIAAYQNLTTNFGDTLLKQWFKDGDSMNAYLKYYNPVDSSTDAVQHIYVIFHAGVEPGYTYNSAGDFYWRDVGAVSDPPGADWSGSYDSILPSSLWQYMTGTTVGWMSYRSPPTSTTISSGFAISVQTCSNCSSQDTMTCPICGVSMVKYVANATYSTLTFSIRFDYNYQQTMTIGYPGTLIYAPTATSDSPSTSLATPPLTWSGTLKSIFTLVSLGSASTYSITICPICSIMDFDAGYSVSSSSSYIRTVPSYSRIVILD